MGTLMVSRYIISMNISSLPKTHPDFGKTIIVPVVVEKGAAKKIRAARKKASLTLKELQAKTGIHHSVLSRIERNNSVTIGSLLQISEAIGGDFEEEITALIVQSLELLAEEIKKRRKANG